MSFGPGKYDSVCTLARTWAAAEGAMLIIINGGFGNGFSVQAPPELAHQLPELLEDVAAQIRADMQKVSQ
jgi:hypothetical protein